MSALLTLVVQDAEIHMRTSSWVFMGAAWLFVTGLLVWSFWRVLGGGRKAS